MARKPNDTTSTATIAFNASVPGRKDLTTNRTPAGQSAGSFRTLPFSSFVIRILSFGISLGHEHADTFRRDLVNASYLN